MFGFSRAALPAGACLVAALLLGSGCAPGGAGRASNIQNVHGISDDIAAVRGTRTDAQRPNDPNYNAVIPSTLGGSELPNR